MPGIDPVKLQADLIEFGRELGQRGPLDLLETARAMVVQLQSYGIEQPPPPPPPPPPPAVVDVEAGPTRVRLGLEQTAGGDRVVARDAQAAPTARTLNELLNILARTPVSKRSSELLELALHMEMLELENAELRNEVRALQVQVLQP